MTHPPGPRRPRRWLPPFAGGALGVAVVAGALVALPRQVPSPPAGAAPSLDIRAVLRHVEPGVVDITDFGQAPSASGARLTGEGSGMILDAQGTVLTNAHVVNGASTLGVQPFGQSTVYTARVLGVDPIDDVALIQIQDPTGLTPVALGSTAGVQVGDPVVAVGNALGLAPGGPTVTDGIISAIHRALSTDTGTGVGSEHLTGLIQTDAPINPGNSGGPLVDAAGTVIGMSTAVSTNGQNIGFAIPIDRITPLLTSLRTGAKAPSTQGFLGVNLGPATGGGPGGQITTVVAGSPAAGAGLRVGDVITAVDGAPVGDNASAADAISANPAGSTVTLKYQRGGVSNTVTVTLASRTS